MVYAAALMRVDDVQPHSIGNCDIVCPFCAARSWPKESLSCCDHGAVVLPDFPVAPPDLAEIIYSPHVKQHIRKYNTALSMASVGHKSRGLPWGAFVLGGKTYHRMGSLLPDAGSPHCFAQIYILDVSAATDRRLGLFGGDSGALRRDVLTRLHNRLLARNPLIQQFVAVARSDVPHMVWQCSDDISTMQLGALVAQAGSRRDIVVQRAQGPSLMSISDGHSLYHPLAYPLLFPLGTGGWNEDMVVVNPEGAIPSAALLTAPDMSRIAAVTSERRLSLTEWGRYHLMHRGDAPTHWQQCGVLSMELYCDMWAQVEARMCHFHSLPKQQMLYRAGRVAAVEDQLHRGVPAGDIGQTVVRLPSSFVGSAKYYQQLYLDALALPRRFGKPDLFITVTCNPRWPEIAYALPAGAVWQDHPDIVSRVFMLKLKSVITDFKAGQIFGVLKAYVYRIEWQARGLPHAHMLLILEHKIMTPAQIDAVVCAEMPDPIAAPALHKLVAAHMLHPRCDMAVREEPHSCRIDKAGATCDCRRRFPKDMAADTVIIGDGFPKYRRRGLHTTTDRSGRIVTDSWVVPYSPYLLLKYQCHANVEVSVSCTSFSPLTILFSCFFFSLCIRSVPISVLSSMCCAAYNF